MDISMEYCVVYWNFMNTCLELIINTMRERGGGREREKERER